jgi:hypothetical protein
MTSQTTRIDPIGDKYFAPLRTADKASDWLFIITAVLSFAALMVEKKDFPNTYNVVQSAFIACAIGLFAIGQAIRLYLWPRAEDRRREDFLSNTLNVSLTHERTSGYYNNTETDPIRRMGVAVLENTHFTMNIALEMARNERIRVALYGFVWLVLVLNRNTDLGWIAVAAQAVFSEQLLSRWLRIEWLRSKAEEIHSALCKVFNSAPSADMLRAYVLDAFGTYETTKANGGVVLSTATFERRNSDLSVEWDKKKQSMNL